MANSLTIPRQQSKEATTNHVKVQTYWDAVRSKLWRDKITMLAILLGVFMVSITLAAPLIGDHLLGFDSVGYPYDSLERNQAKRNRNAPPTWFEEGWATFQSFSNTCELIALCRKSISHITLIGQELSWLFVRIILVSISTYRHRSS